MDWHLFISLATLVLVIFTIVWGTGLWTRRERIEIIYPNMVVQLKTNEVTGIDFEYSFSIFYIRGTRDHYVSEIWLEFDKRSWKKLWPYFKIPLKLSKIIGQDELSKLEIGKPKQFGYDDFFPARKTIVEEERKELDDLVQKLWHRYKIGWKDTYRKTQSKTIPQLREINKMFER